jgi:RNA polymerase sigma factor (sigma-70 family)
MYAPQACSCNLYPSTSWSPVGRADSPEKSREALGQLVSAYWRPLYTYVRSRELSEDAEDVVQAFFAQFLEKKYVLDFRPDRGRFWTFILASLKHFLANLNDARHAISRGGTVEHLSIDSPSIDPSELESATAASLSNPDREFERNWALTLLERVQARLRDEMDRMGKIDIYEALAPIVLESNEHDTSYRDIGRRLGMSEGAVKVSAHRLRRRYRDMIRAEIEDTVDDPAEVDDELRFLMSALGH